jgi:signal transduction histidine kinase
LAQDEAVAVMARTTSHELSQPLTYLLGVLELWEAGRLSDDCALVRRGLREAASDLAARVQMLGTVVRYEPRDLAGYRLLDLELALTPRATGSAADGGTGPTARG